MDVLELENDLLYECPPSEILQAFRYVMANKEDKLVEEPQCKILRDMLKKAPGKFISEMNQLERAYQSCQEEWLKVLKVNLENRKLELQTRSPGEPTAKKTGPDEGTARCRELIMRLLEEDE